MNLHNLPPAVQESLARLAKSSDRAPPTVFVGRSDEFDLLDDAVRGAQCGEPGHTVVIQGVPGAGKTALLNEYAVRLLTARDNAKPIIPVRLLPNVLKAPPMAIVQQIDKHFRTFEASDEWKRRINHVVDGASLLGNALFAAITRKDFNDFRLSAQSPESLPVALEDYLSFRFDRRDSTIVLLVDEAQNLSDASQVRDHLEMLHAGMEGHTQVVLVCLGLSDTTNRLRELGLSRLASDHVRSIGALSDEDAKRTVIGTLEIAFADFAFDEVSCDEVSCDEGRRTQWIETAAATILDESANFPHHLTNGCRALAKIVLDEGVNAVPPTGKLRERCREHKRRYYDARLRPWEKHTVALAHAFAGAKFEWTPIGDIVPVLMASDNYGRPVDADTATAVIEELCVNGYVENHMGVCRPVLPSLASHFMEMQRGAPAHSTAVQAVQAALSKRSEPAPERQAP